MARDLVVRVIGDSRSLERAMGKSSKAVQGFGASVDKSVKQMSGFQRGLIGGFAGSVAISSTISALTDVVKLAAESEQVLGQTQVALESAGKSWGEYGDQIQDTIKAQSQFGFDDEALLRAFSLFIRGTDSVSEALRRNELAMDVARGRFIDLDQAALLVNKAVMGQVGALRRLGLQVDQNASGAELLAFLQAKYGSAAEAANDDAATSMQRLSVQIENVKESIGTALLPLVTGLADALEDMATAAEAASIGVQKLGDVGQKLVPEAVSRRFGLFKEVLLRLNPATALYKNFGFAADFLADKLGLVNDELAETAKFDFSAVAQLTQGLTAQPLFGVTSPMAAPLTAEQRRRFFDARIARQLERAQTIGDLQGIAGQIRTKMKTTRDATRLLNLDDQLWRIQQMIQQKRAQAAATAKQIAEQQAAAAKQAADARKQTQLGWLEFALERAQATKIASDDLKALKALEKYWLERIRLEGRTLDLMRELWRVQQAIRDQGKKNADGDPLAGLMQVNTKRLTSILAAGTGLGAAGRRVLGANISAQQLRPIYMSVQLDGREVSKSVTQNQTRTGKRTGNQTSGRRG